MLDHRNSEIGGDADGGGGQTIAAHQRTHATPAPIPEIVGLRAGEGEDGQRSSVTQGPHAGLAATVDTIREEWRQRQAWMRAETGLTLQAKALCRRLADGGDKAEAERIFKAALGTGEHPHAAVARVSILPLVEARKAIEAHRKVSERTLVALARQLPVAPFVEATRGVGLLSLAAIVGEAGDLGAYANPAKVWKRFGAAVIDGGRQRRVAGLDALRHGYAPVRRAVLWNIGACIIRSGGPLKDLYDARKVDELAKCEAIAADPVERARYARAGRYAPKLHAHNRARRYVEKRFLRDLWRAWRGFAVG
jgi:hypothetical protein